MLLLASRLGLRASDIANLKFSNIDWDKNEIKLTQYMTGHPITLPLLNDVGNAIIDTSNMAALSLNLRRFLSPLALRMSRPTKGYCAPHYGKLFHNPGSKYMDVIMGRTLYATVLQAVF